MATAKGMRFSPDVILVYLRGYAVYPLSYRHLEKMMQDRCVRIGHSSSNRKAILRILRIGVRAAASMQASAPVHRALIGVPVAPRPIWQLTLFPLCQTNCCLRLFAGYPHGKRRFKHKNPHLHHSPELKEQALLKTRHCCTHLISLAGSREMPCLSKQRRGLAQVSFAILARRRPIKSSEGRAWFA